MPAFLPIIAGIDAVALVGIILLASRVLAVVNFAKWGAKRVSSFFNSRGA